MYSNQNIKTPLMSQHCKNCGSEMVAKGNGYYICPVCNDLYQDNLSKMRIFLTEYPDSTAEDLSKQFAYDLNYVQQCIDEGLLSPEAIRRSQRHCQRCKCSIPFGRYCDKCKQNLAGDLRNAFL